jgi:formylglycine-generating enzyme required for sulfatase activity
MDSNYLIRLAALIIILIAPAPSLKANNIQVSNIQLTNLNEASNWVHVEFDLAWENSWRVSSGPSNWDAAWVFIKYSVNGGNWTHAILSQADSVAAVGSTLTVTPDGVGAFVHRSEDGAGDIEFRDTQLRWNYGSTDLNAVIDIKVFAIEMVYIPEGAFSLGGTTGDESNKFHLGGFSTSSSYLVASEEAITIANTQGNLYYVNNSSGAGDQTGTLFASYPKGYGAFYCMKYETSEGQWVDFFNCLSDTQKAKRDITGPDSKNSDLEFSRNTISWTSGEATTTAPDRAVSYISAGHMNAYMDWAGLRPMTELEYEKACRGPLVPKAGEFAWGTSQIATNAYTLINSGSAFEQIINAASSVGNASYTSTDGSIDGPLRCGIFASSAVTKTRQETGGSYYGVMELSGNLYERCVTVGTSRGRNFTAIHGNGIISSTGDSTVSLWPDNITGDGYGYRGGSWVNGSDFLRVSDRFDGASVIGSANNRLGLRAVRTAP